MNPKRFEDVKSNIIKKDLIDLGMEEDSITSYAVKDHTKVNFELSGLILGILVVVGLLGYYLYISFAPQGSESFQNNMFKGIESATNNIFTRKSEPITRIEESNVVKRERAKKEIVKAKPIENVVAKENAFITNKGKRLETIYDLANEFEVMDENTFRHHVNDNKNDFAEWVATSLKDPILARRLRKQTKRELMALEILRYIKK